MQFAIIFLAPILFAIQTSAFKQYGIKCDNSKGAVASFKTLYLLLSCLVAAPFALSEGAMSPETLFFGIVFGIEFFLFVTLYGEALKLGPLSITSFLFAMCMIIPIIISAFVYDEKLGTIQVVAFVLMLISIYFINFAQSHSKEGYFSKKWIIYCIIGFLVNGILQFTMKSYSIEVENASTSQFIFIAYIVCLLLSFIPFVSKNLRDDFKAMSINKWFIALAIALGLTNFFGNFFFTMASSMFMAQVVFPINNGGTVMLSVVLGMLLFKEKLKVKAIIGIVIGVIAIVLLSI